jgi:hypothetical protein
MSARGESAPSADARRLAEIATARLEAARAMRALSAREPEILQAIDRAARGEIDGESAEDALRAHLDVRERLVARMREGEHEWAAIAPRAGALSDAELAPVRTMTSELAVLIAEISGSDRAFAVELVRRRDAAREEMSRTDTARAAGRAYGAGRDDSPRFTDRRA